RKLGGPDAQPSTLRFAKFSPQGDRIAYVRDNDLYVERVSDGAITRLTTTGSATILNGVADWVDEEELYLRDCFRWSPDGTTIAYWQFDQSGVPVYDIINDTDSLYPTITPQPYPVPGATNASVHAGVVSANGGPTTWLQLPGDARQHYIAYMEWTGPHELLVQHLDRLQQHDDLMLADASTGAVHSIFTEADSAWVDVNRDVPWIDSGRRFLWLSDRDGWRHVYSVSHDGRDSRLLTPGAYDVEAIDGVDQHEGMLYITASPDNATQRYLYRVSLRTPGAPTRVTPAPLPGTHAYDVSPDGRWAIHTYSTFDTPPVIDLVQLPKHTTARTLATNERLRAAVASLVSPPVEFFKVNVAKDVTLDGWMLRPRDFDPSKKYPVFVYVYGEPAAQTVTDRWGGTNILWHRFIANQGYIVISVDNQGTPAPRGRHWRKLIYGAIGPLASAQQAAAIRELERTRPYLDAARVGIHGHSGGGSQTLNALFRHPDVYQVGEAVSSVPDQRFYDSIYEERYVGLPREHPENYEVSSPINFAAGLRGKLLVVHGSGDDNVHYKGAEALNNRLIALGKSFDFMVYPNRSHCDCEGPGTTLHLYTLLTRYLLTNLPAGPRPR
ncbi:MAG TPA: S9 family peptidase, partial [Gemmatimonadaceae bacterium]